MFLLEDEHCIREVISLILELEGYRAVGFEIVEAFMLRDRTDLPDLFILDVMLPDGNGTEVCWDLKYLGNALPVLMISAHASSGDVPAWCCADAFLPKPFDINQLVRIVKELTMT